MSALKVNIIIVHPWDVVFPRALAFYVSPRENKISRVMFTLSAGINCIIFAGGIIGPQGYN